MTNLHRCRVCGGSLYAEQLIVFPNMPDAAQFLPNKDTLVMDKGTDLEVYQCSCCSLVQLICEPVHYYQEVVRSSAFSAEMRRFRLSQFSTLVHDYSLKGKTAIEIGCGRGEYLELLKDCGLNVHGIEYSSKSVQTCLDKNFPVSRGFVNDENYLINNGPFDLFFILNFLEHLPTPQITLRGISNNLNEDAIGLVEVPNFDMILDKGLFSEFIHDHLFYFTTETLSSLLSNNGFDVLECCPIWHDYIISALVRKKARANVTLLHQRQQELKINVDQFISQFDSGRIAIWGAGHQALANISLLELSSSVTYVVDSAPFKQGKFTPATHLPIVAPEMLQIQPVDGVLVMAASYSDEVASILRRDFDSKLTIGILRDYGVELK